MNDSAKAFQLTEQEYNYLLAPLGHKMSKSDRYIIVNSIEDLDDVLNRLKGCYDYFGDLKSMVAYNCSVDRSLKPFRDSIGVTI